MVHNTINIANGEMHIYSKIEEEKDRVYWVMVVHGDNVAKA